MSYTLGTAAKATGKSKTAIWRAISNGKISASKDVNGQYQIEPAELHRVFPPVSCDETETVDLEQSAMTGGTDVNAQMLALELRILKDERERERERLQNQIDDLRHRLDDEAAERRRLTMLLTHQPEAAPEGRAEPERTGFRLPPWAWLFVGAGLVAATVAAFAWTHPEFFA